MAYFPATAHAHNGKAVLNESEEILIQTMFDFLDSNRDGQLNITQVHPGSRLLETCHVLAA
jgi:hypothetical protein